MTNNSADQSEATKPSELSIVLDPFIKHELSAACQFSAEAVLRVTRFASDAPGISPGNRFAAAAIINGVLSEARSAIDKAIGNALSELQKGLAE